MDDARFDRLTRVMASGHTRRSIFATGLGALLALLRGDSEAKKKGKKGKKNKRDKKGEHCFGGEPCESGEVCCSPFLDDNWAFCADPAEGQACCPSNPGGWVAAGNYCCSPALANQLNRGNCPNGWPCCHDEGQCSPDRVCYTGCCREV
jgi:hypothetical protein